MKLVALFLSLCACGALKRSQAARLSRAMDTIEYRQITINVLAYEAP